MMENEFWNWFQVRRSEIEKFIVSGQDDFTIFNELTDKLRSYNDLVIAELTQDTENRNILILSCDGRRDGIEPVERLYKSAPTIDNWRIQKFRAPGHVTELNYQGLSIKPDDIMLKYNFDGAGYNIELFMKGYREKDDRYKALAFLYLDHLVGEYNVMTRIGQIEFKKLGLFSSSSDKVALREFRAIVERLN